MFKRQTNILALCDIKSSLFHSEIAYGKKWIFENFCFTMVSLAWDVSCIASSLILSVVWHKHYLVGHKWHHYGQVGI